jgi:flagellar basal body L-ring protein FlgH
MGVLGAGLAATALPASATATTNSYTIGSLTGSVSNVTISPTTTTAGTIATPVNESEELYFTATSALTTANTITVTANEPLGTVTAVQLIDQTGPCLYNAGTPAVVGDTFTVTLPASCTIAVGNTVQVDFTFQPTVTGTTAFTITTTNNGSASSAADLTVNSTPPSLSASSLTTGYNAVYTITNIGVSGATGGSWATLTPTTDTAWLQLTAPSPVAGFAFYNGIAGYTVTVTPSGGSATTDALTGFYTVSPYTTVDLELTSDILSGSTVTVTAEGTNGSVAGNTQAFTITKEDDATAPPSGTAPTFTATPSPTETTNAITFGSSVTAVTVTPSPTLAGASSNYTVSFTAGTTGTPAAICISELADSTSFINVSGALITDTTGGWQYVPSTILHAAYVAGTTNAGCGGFYDIVLDLSGQTISAGDSVTVLLAGVTNPTAQTVSDFVVATTKDQLTATAAPYAITVSEAAGISVTASPATVGSLSTYTISNIVVGSAGVLAGQAITIATTTEPGTDTVFPNNVLDYVITDTTTAAGSGTVSAPVPLTGGGTNTVTIDSPKALVAGDIISITINDVINPTTSGTYALTLTNANLGTPSVVAPAFPKASVTYPEGGIVDFGGTYYLFAGGHAFGIPTLAVLASIQVIDHAVVLTAATGATPPVTSPLLGTEIIVYNNPTIYVVGTSGLNGFATPAQFLGDGYDPADVITVPNFGGLSVGATVGSVGTGDNVIGTASNGALIDSSGEFFVVAGGRACGIPSLPALANVQAGDQATPLVGAVPSSWTTSVMENGTLVTVNSAVFEADGGDLFELKAPSQLAADGLGGTPSLVLANYCGMPVVTSYTGS